MASRQARNIVRTVTQIQNELDAASERRKSLWSSLPENPGEQTRTEVEDLNEQIAGLWQELRSAKAFVRMGPRETIIARGRVEDRFDREERRIRRIAA